MDEHRQSLVYINNIQMLKKEHIIGEIRITQKEYSVHKAVQVLRKAKASLKLYLASLQQVPKSPQFKKENC